MPYRMTTAALAFACAPGRAVPGARPERDGYYFHTDAVAWCG